MGLTCFRTGVKNFYLLRKANFDHYLTLVRDLGHVNKLCAMHICVLTFESPAQNETS